MSQCGNGNGGAIKKGPGSLFPKVLVKLIPFWLHVVIPVSALFSIEFPEFVLNLGSVDNSDVWE